MKRLISVYTLMALMMGVGQHVQAQGSDYSTAANTSKNQAVLTMKDGSQKYYDTESVTSIDFANGGADVTVNHTAGSYTFKSQVQGVSFNKVVKGTIQVTEAKGWLESAYVKFGKLDGAKGYHVYVKGGPYSDYTKIDHQLVRNYGTYGRADVVGLPAGTYSLKVVAVNGSGVEVSSTASETGALEVKNYNRDGFAHYNATEGIGAYNNDGTLKTGARVIYVTKNNAKTVQLSMNAGKGEETRTGIQDIIQAYEKGLETRPLAVRIIGQLKASDLDYLGSSAIGLQVKGKGQHMNLTIEGIGSDATLHGLGVLCRNCQYVELRNFAVMMHPEDGISFDTNNEHLWGHHLDIFYGQNKGGDKSKGDGSFDVKGTFYCTVSDNHFWDAGKCNLNSNGDEVDYVTYRHNWYDHSDSRHPRVRMSKHLHVYNNYYDGNSKYGVGSTTGSCIFVEKNYFRNCKYPMLISRQGSDVHNGVGSSEATKGTFSNEDGGIIKAFDNYMTGQNSFEPYVAGDALYSKHFDAYVVTNRNDQVPAEVVTLQGGTNYNNFDTASDFYSYTPHAAADVPAIVTGFYGAGRCEHGDFQWTFNNSTEDKNAEVITTLSNSLKDYNTSLVGIFGDDHAESGSQGDNDEQGEQGGTTPAPEGIITATFNASPSSPMFSVGGSYGDGNITYNGTSLKKGVKLDSKGSITFTPAKNYNMTIVMGTAKNGRDVKINNVLTTVSGTENAEGKYYQLQPIAITKDTQYVITKGSAEGLVMVIILEPIE